MWKIAIDGVGPRENGDAHKSVQRMLSDFVSDMRKNGYIVTCVTMQHTLDMTGNPKRDGEPI